jgi:hypothetical protein
MSRSPYEITTNEKICAIYLDILHEVSAHRNRVWRATQTRKKTSCYVSWFFLYLDLQKGGKIPKQTTSTHKIFVCIVNTWHIYCDTIIIILFSEWLIAGFILKDEACFCFRLLTYVMTKLRFNVRWSLLSYYVVRTQNITKSYSEYVVDWLPTNFLDTCSSRPIL